MINYKSEKEIQTMREGGEILKKVYSELKPLVVAGVTTFSIDAKAQALIKAYGGDISFNKVAGYKYATCITINEQVVHTQPSKRIIKNEDVITIDIGVFYKGFHVDYSDTFVVGISKNKEVEKFLKTGQDALYDAIAKVKVGEYLGTISSTIQKKIEGNGYFIMRELSGHGVGRSLHEDPLIPGYLDEPLKDTIKIKNGLVIAIEVIYSMGTTEIVSEDDWSLITDDGSLSACFEHTLAVDKNRSFILT